mgnify:CR=1 FL=1
MKTIGFIGGMSWESSAIYYQLANRLVKKRLGQSHSSQNIMLSVDFQEIAELQHAGKWEELTSIMVDAAVKLEKAGAESIVICTNTMHLMAPDVQQAVSIPLLHIADAVGEAIKARGIDTVALLGTGFTMEKGFYKEMLEAKFGIGVITPDEGDRALVHNIIYRELVRGIFRPESRDIYGQVIGRLQERGAGGVILGCTEIPLLIQQEHVEIPLFDTTTIHAEKAVEWQLG